MKEILLLVLGALATGLLQTILGVLDRRREAESMVTAIASEVDAICRLIRHQRYLEAFESQLKEIESGTWDGHPWVIDIRENYFSVFEALAPQLGHLTPYQANRIVNFYAYCKSAIDSTRPDSPANQDPNLEIKAEGIRGTVLLLRSILALGQEVVSFPKATLTSGLTILADAAGKPHEIDRARTTSK